MTKLKGTPAKVPGPPSCQVQVCGRRRADAAQIAGHDLRGPLVGEHGQRVRRDADHRRIGRQRLDLIRAEPQVLGLEAPTTGRRAHRGAGRLGRTPRLGPLRAGERLHRHQPAPAGHLVAHLVGRRHTGHRTDRRVAAHEGRQPVDLGAGSVDDVPVLSHVLHDARSGGAQTLDPRPLDRAGELDEHQRFAGLGRALGRERLALRQRVEADRAGQAHLAQVVPADGARRAQLRVVLPGGGDEREVLVVGHHSHVRAAERGLGAGLVGHQQEVRRAIGRGGLCAREGRIQNEAAQGGHGYGQTTNAPDVYLRTLTALGDPT